MHYISQRRAGGIGVLDENYNLLSVLSEFCALI